MAKTAVVLFNLGGPDRPESVRPFLFNLFRDPKIIGLPDPFRWLLAHLISFRRAPYAETIYRSLGGGSPLLKETRQQADALEKILGEEFKVFVAMRYWHPRTSETVLSVAQWAPDQIVLLPLYPQFSTTTTASSFLEWKREVKTAGLDVPTFSVDSYPENDGLIRSFVELTAPVLEQARSQGDARVLFSAHGIPKRRIVKGDPYRDHMMRSVRRIVSGLSVEHGSFDWRVCYQSRIGPLEWLGPSIADEIRRAGKDRVSLVVVPVSFVSEHIETLHELDVQYRTLAEQCGIPFFGRVPAPGVHPCFIRGLAEEVNKTLMKPDNA